MRRLVGFALITALMAPAVAVCAAGEPPARRSSEHDCCPKDTAVISTAAESSTAGTACCRMSADAAQRTAIQAVVAAPASAPVEPISFWLGQAPLSRSFVGLDSHPESPHIARHLLLSVLLI
jgi:hypothetical protein